MMKVFRVVRQFHFLVVHVFSNLRRKKKSYLTFDIGLFFHKFINFFYSNEIVEETYNAFYKIFNNQGLIFLTFCELRKICKLLNSFNPRNHALRPLLKKSIIHLPLYFYKNVDKYHELYIE